jgi:hypothetical protein
MIRFLADADLNGAIVDGLSANDANLEGGPTPTCWR